jgi:hydroxymethylpyrimidine/phosphomethylpyrimidine kinase
MRVCLTIAGSDSIAGAGIQADLKVFNALGVHGTSVITSVTAQNTLGVQMIHNLPPAMVEGQLNSVFGDVRVDSVKVGMLSQKSTVEVVVQILREHKTPDLVIDPVMVAKGGTVLLEDDARESLKTNLLPIGRIVTPNLYEASWLSGIDVTDLRSMKKAAEIIHQTGVDYVLVKGGHLEAEVADILYDGEAMEVLKGDGRRWNTVHGTGCILSAAITAGLAKGWDVRKSVEQAKSYLRRTVGTAETIGKGWKVATQFGQA